MRPLERIPAVRRIDTDRDDAFAIEITGEFHSADAENLWGLLEGAYSLHERIDLLVRLAALDEVDLSELSAETAASMKQQVAQHVSRCAVIGDDKWLARVSTLFEPSSGVEVQHFPPDAEAQAWQWLGVREIRERI